MCSVTYYWLRCCELIECVLLITINVFSHLLLVSKVVTTAVCSGKKHSKVIFIVAVYGREKKLKSTLL